MEYMLSHSKLKILRECPRCFWLLILKKVERPKIGMASIVLKLDLIIKKYFDHYRDSGTLPPIIKDKIQAKLAKNIPETLYSIETNGISLMGKLDECLELEDGSIAVLDYKTAGQLPKNIHPVYQAQLDIYTYLLQINGYKTTNKAFLAYFYPIDSELHNGLKIECKIIEITPDVQRVKKLLEQAQTILLNEIPNPSKDCEFCNLQTKNHLNIKE